MNTDASNKVSRKPRFIRSRIWGAVGRRFKKQFLYLITRSPKVRGSVSVTPEMALRIKRQLIDAGLHVEELTLNPDDYSQYFTRADYSRFDHYQQHMGMGFREKTLQHYVSALLLNLSPGRTLIDVASCESPAPRIYRDLYGCEVWVLDIIYPEGIHDRKIGGNAAAMPVADAFADYLTLHCSFEHFEGDADSRFMREAARVLKPGGKLCILPLYLADTYAIQTDPQYLPWRGMTFDAGATIYFADNWRNRHGRLYDVPHFLNRVEQHLCGMTSTIYMVTNAQEINPNCHLKFAVVFTKPRQPDARAESPLHNPTRKRDET